MAKKAVTEIKKTPPKLILYSIASAAGIILLVVVYMAFHIRSENSDDDSTPAQSAADRSPSTVGSTVSGRSRTTNRAARLGQNSGDMRTKLGITFVTLLLALLQVIAGCSERTLVPGARDRSTRGRGEGSHR